MRLRGLPQAAGETRHGVGELEAEIEGGEMTIELNEGTPFYADITATEGHKRYRLIVEDRGSAAVYLEARDDFGRPHWEGATNVADYHEIIAKIIVALARRDYPISTETRPTEDSELMEG